MSVERKRRGNKKNKLEEIQKPRGYDREFLLDRIVGATTDAKGDLMFLIKWQECNEYDLLMASQVNEKNPQEVISFYEERCLLNQKALQHKKIDEEYEMNLMTYPPKEKEYIEELPATEKEADASAENVATEAAVENAPETESEVVAEETTPAETATDQSEQIEYQPQPIDDQSHLMASQENQVVQDVEMTEQPQY